MKVIGAGFGRTGTLSLKKGLEILGFTPCYHGFEVIEKPEHVELWDRAAEGDREALRKAVDGYEAGVDWPIAAFYKELAEEFPQSRIILTTRDPERWFDSASSTIFHAVELGHQCIFGFPRWHFRMMRRVVLEDVFSGKHDDKQHAMTVFKNHIEDVKTIIPSERLLVYQASQGWEPLCKFLDVPIPDEPFPFVNDKKSMHRLLKVFQVFIWLQYILPLILVIAFCIFLMRV